VRSIVIYAAISASLILLAHGILPRGYTPGHVWAYAWAFAWACQAILGAGYLLDMGTVAFVTACNFAFILAAYIASAGRAHEPAENIVSCRRQELEVASKIRSTACIASIVLGLIALNSGLKEMGNQGLVWLFSGSLADFQTSLVETKTSFANEREWVTPAAISVALVFLTCAAILSGIESAIARRERRRVAGVLLVGLAAFAFIASAGTGVRGYLLVTGLFFCASYLAAKIFVLGGAFRIPGCAYVVGIVTAFVFLIWVVVVQSARRGDFSFGQVGETLDYLRLWFAGYLPALSQWSSGADLHGGGVPGMHLLAGVLSNLGIGQGEGFTEKISQAEIGDGVTSNAMTVFRVLLVDFGYPGSLVACVVAGFISQQVYLRVLRGSAWAIVPLAAIYAAALYSFNYWLFARGSRIGGVVLAFIIVVVSTRLRSAVPRRPSVASPDRTADGVGGMGPGSNE